MRVYLDHSATTPLSDSMKEYLISILDFYGNPSSSHSLSAKPRQLLSDARRNVAAFIGADPEEIFFTPSGSASNTLAVRGLTSENPRENRYEVFYSPTSHKSMLKACESCVYHTPLRVTGAGAADLSYLDDILTRHDALKPVVCIEAANSETGAVNDVPRIGSVVHAHGGLFAVDATGYIPSYPIDMKAWRRYADILTFSGHKLHALKGVGVLWKPENISLKPLVYGSQERGIVGGTENITGIASLGRAVLEYRYDSVTADGRDYVYDYIIRSIPECFLVGPSIESGDRLPQNLYLCFKGIDGESLLLLLDMHGIQVSTGSACNSRSLTASAALTAIGMKEEDIRSCIRLTFSGTETREELDYVCEKIKQCAESLRRLSACCGPAPSGS